MKKLIITTIILIYYSSGFSQSSIVYEPGTILDIGAGADVCADLVTVNGIHIGSGTICEGPLPVELLTFHSETQNNSVKLHWTTASELNNSGFEIQRVYAKGVYVISENEWKKIGFVHGMGTISIPYNYNYEDRGLSSGSYRYRLKQIDYIGNYEYFNLESEVEIGIPVKYFVSQNYPNPFNPVTNIDYEIPFEGYVSLKIYDNSGKEIFTLINETKTSGYYSVQFDASDLSSGVYHYVFLANNKRISVKNMVILK